MASIATQEKRCFIEHDHYNDTMDKYNRFILRVLGEPLICLGLYIILTSPRLFDIFQVKVWYSHRSCSDLDCMPRIPEPSSNLCDTVSRQTVCRAMAQPIIPTSLQNQPLCVLLRHTSGCDLPLLCPHGCRVMERRSRVRQSVHGWSSTQTTHQT